MTLFSERISKIERIETLPGSLSDRPISFIRFKDGSVLLYVYDRHFNLLETVTLTADQAERLKEI